RLDHLLSKEQSVSAGNAHRKHASMQGYSGSLIAHSLSVLKEQPIFRCSSRLRGCPVSHRWMTYGTAPLSICSTNLSLLYGGIGYPPVKGLRFGKAASSTEQTCNCASFAPRIGRPGRHSCIGAGILGRW